MDWASRKSTVEKLLRDQVVNFLGYLLTVLKTESYLLTALSAMKDDITPEDLTKVFCDYIWPCEEKILNRDESFFLTDESIFDGLNCQVVGYFKNIWLSTSLTDENKNRIWEWFAKFNKICKAYKKVLADRPEDAVGVEGIVSGPK